MLLSGGGHRYRSCMTALAHHPGDSQANGLRDSSPMRLGQGTTVTQFVNGPLGLTPIYGRGGVPILRVSRSLRS